MLPLITARYTRVPVHDRRPGVIVGVLLTRDLLLAALSLQVPTVKWCRRAHVIVFHPRAHLDACLHGL